MLLGEEAIEFYTPPPSAVAKAESGEEFTLWDSDGFNFGDLLDVVNPLQHIPVVSTVYRDLTGDDIGHAPRILGGALFGGAIGAAVSLANVLVDEATGNDIGGHVMAFLLDDGTDGGAPGGGTEVAATSHGSSSAAVAKPWINPDTQPRAEPLGAAVRQAIVRPDPVEATAPPVTPARSLLPVTEPPVGGRATAAPSDPMDAQTPPNLPTMRNDGAAAVRPEPPEAARQAIVEREMPAGSPTPPPPAKPLPGALAALQRPGAVPPYSVGPDTQIPFLPESMLSALEKYERLVRERKPNPGRVDLSG